MMDQSRSLLGGDRRTVLIADDHPVVRTGVRAMVEGHERFEIVGDAQDGIETLEASEAIDPDIVVIDLSLPRLGGIEVIFELKRRQPRVEVVVFSMHRGEQIVLQAMEAGARGYVCKDDGEHLLPALEAVSRGQTYLSPTVDFGVSRDSRDERWDHRSLTVRERQIVRLVAEGKSNKLIARTLNLSIKTVETHRASAMRKTGANSAPALTIYAARNGLVDL
jgi:DNA-binding NarL/FixJ family response regulator